MCKAKKSCSKVCSDGSQNGMGYIAPAKGLISVKVKVVERERETELSVASFSYNMN